MAHTHDGVPCEVEDCRRPYDLPTVPLGQSTVPATESMPQQTGSPEPVEFPQVETVPTTDEKVDGS